MTTEDDMVGWHHQVDGHEFEQGLGVSDGPGSLACCSPWSRKELDMTGRLNSKNNLIARVSQVVLMVKKPPANAGDL